MTYQDKLLAMKDLSNWLQDGITKGVASQAAVKAVTRDLWKMEAGIYHPFLVKFMAKLSAMNDEVKEGDSFCQYLPHISKATIISICNSLKVADIHEQTAKTLLVGRRIAKTVNFGLLYGKPANS